MAVVCKRLIANVGCNRIDIFGFQTGFVGSAHDRSKALPRQDIMKDVFGSGSGQQALGGVEDHERLV